MAETVAEASFATHDMGFITPCPHDVPFAEIATEDVYREYFFASQ